MASTAFRTASTALFVGLLALLLALLVAHDGADTQNMASAPLLLKKALPIAAAARGLAERCSWMGLQQHRLLPRELGYKSYTATPTTTSPAVLSASSISAPRPRLHHTRPFSSSSSAAAAATMSASKTFIDAVKERRTYYALNKTPPVSDDRIIELVNETVLHTPSAFNSQSARVVVLLKAEHDHFWEMVKEVLKAMVPPEQFAATETRINGFKAGYGTALFFEDPAPVTALQAKFPIYAQHFPTWSEHTSAMHQFVLWTALEAEGLGANLQHYNPIIDQKAQEHYNIPQEWALRAQLVFGGRAGQPNAKEYKAVEERVFVHGK